MHLIINEEELSEMVADALEAKGIETEGVEFNFEDGEVVARVEVL